MQGQAVETTCVDRRARHHGRSAQPDHQVLRARGPATASPTGDNRYRTYDDSTVTRLQFIKSVQPASLTLGEVRGIVELRDRGDAPCSHVASLLDRKLTDVRARQRELSALESDLKRLLQRSRHLEPGDCTETAGCHILTGPR